MFVQCGAMWRCRRDIRSLRDLTAEHLPLLRNILNKGAQVHLSRDSLLAESLDGRKWQALCNGSTVHIFDSPVHVPFACVHPNIPSGLLRSTAAATRAWALLNHPLNSVSCISQLTAAAGGNEWVFLMLCMQAIWDRFSVPAEQLRVYVHYQPSYYHFHVHFVHTSYDGAMGLAAGKAHLLGTIIGTWEAHLVVDWLHTGEDSWFAMTVGCHQHPAWMHLLPTMW